METEEQVQPELELPSDPTAMSDEDLVNFINQAHESLETTEPQEDGETEQQTEEESAEQETQTDGQKQEEPTVQISKDEWEKRKQMLEQQEQFIKRRGTELGQLRQQYQNLLKENSELKQQANDAGDTEELVKALQQEKELQAKDQEAQSQQQKLVELETKQRVVASHLSAEEGNIESMAGVLARMGTPPEKLESFKQNPYDHMSGEALVFLGKLQNTEKLLAQTVVYTKQLLKQNKELQGKPTEVLDKVAQVAKQGPKLTGSGGSQPAASVPADLTSLQDDELDALLKSLS